MAGQALPFSCRVVLHRLGGFRGDVVMAGDAEFLDRLSQITFPDWFGSRVAEITIPFGIGFMNLGTNGTFALGPVGIMAFTAVPTLDGGEAMRFFCGDLLRRVAGKAEVLSNLDQQAILVG
jgi:hypothetical protein